MLRVYISEVKSEGRDAMLSEKTKTAPTCVYTDLPTRVHHVSGGLIGTEADCNMLITWATGRAYNPEAEGTLAIRWTSRGQRFFESDRRRFAVDDSSYLLFNAGRRFSSFIQSETPVECYTVGFAPRAVNQVLHGLVSPADRLLDDPNFTPEQPLQFLEKSYPHDAFVSPFLFQLQQRRDSEEATHGWFEEQFQALLVGLLHAHRNVLCEVEKVPAARAATRTELYRRMHVARDYMEAYLHDPLTIPQIAAAAWLSPYHFLRLFKQVFRETPHQYIIRRRLERARHLLIQTDAPITTICFSLGFESLGSFSWLFRQRLGLSPQAFRQQKGLLTASSLRSLSIGERKAPPRARCLEEI